MSFVIHYDDVIDLIAINDLDNFKVLHLSKPLLNNGIGCVVYTTNNFYKIGFVITENNKVLEVKEFKFENFLKPILFELFNIKPNNYINTLQSKKVIISDYFGMLINNSKLTLFVNMTYSLAGTNYLVQIDVENFNENSFNYNTFKDVDFNSNIFYNTTNVILGHIHTNVYSYTDYVSDNGNGITNYDGIVVIERNSVKDSIAGKNIRLIEIVNSDNWFEKGLEFPKLDLNVEKSIRDYKIIGKVPNDSNIKDEIKFDFSTGMLIF
jgi:hypothetical protein